MNINSKIALLSHILPPSPSGQAMVLYRLLNELDHDNYCLISRENYEKHNGVGSSKLPARYYKLKPVFQLPIINYFKTLIMAINTIEIYIRAKQIEKIIRKEHCKLLIACTGDLYDLPAAYLASKWTDIPFVPYIFDFYAYQWTDFNRSISKRLEPIILKHAKGLIVPNEHLQKEYIQRYAVSSTVIHNPCLLPDLDDLDKADKVFNNHEINIVYTGAIYHAHYDAFRNIITAIQQLKRSDVKLHLYTAQTESELIHNGISGNIVVYHPHINNSEVPKVLRHASILFLPLAFDSPIPEVIKTSAPGKTGEYLSVGRPVLVHAPPDSFVSWYFKENQCGLVVDKNDPSVLSEALKKIISDKNLQIELGKKARTQAEKDFDVTIIQSKFIDFIKTIIEEV